MLDLEMNVGLDTGPIEKMCGAGSVPGPDFREILTSLVRMRLQVSIVRIHT